MHYHHGDAAAGEDPVLDPEVLVPFEEILVPLIIRDARGRAHREARGLYGHLGDEAHSTLERGLLLRVASLCSRALYTHFAVFRSMEAGSLALGGLTKRSTAYRSDLVYQAFIGRMLGGGFTRLLRDHRVLARLLANVVDRWVEATVELLRRLDDDREELNQVFGKIRSLGAVEDLVVGVGDPHDGGRSVVILRFESGQRIVYKPRPVGLERFYGEIVDALKVEEARLPNLRIPSQIFRENYGWIEFVEHGSCATDDQIALFYHRMGMILALVYVMTGHDCHLENLIVAGAHPVLIDLETLVSHGLDTKAEADMGYQGEGAARARYKRSVAATGLLPVPRQVPSGPVIDLGGLGGPVLDTSSHEVPYWRNPNTDHMRMAYLAVRQPEPTNVPDVDGRRCFAPDYVDDIVDGFRRTYRRVVEIKPHFFNDARLARLGQQQVRFILRPTNLYAQLLQRGLHPKYLRTEESRAALLTVLAAPLRQLGRPEATEAILEAECHALQQMDIPCFSARADEIALKLPTGQRIEHFFDRTAVDEVRSRISGLNEEDMAFQIELIRMALNSRAAAGLCSPFSDPIHAGGEDAVRNGRSHDQSISADLAHFRETTLREAMRIAAEIERRAVKTPGRTPGWIGINYVPRLRCHVSRPLPPTFFSGSAGLALFLAAVGRLTSTCHRRLVLETVDPLRNVARLPSGNEQAMEKAIRFHWSDQLGVAEGLAGGVYCLAHLATLLDTPELAEDARRLASYLTAERVRSTGTDNLVSGTSGIVLALLALHRCKPDDSLLAQAVELGSPLVSPTRAKSDGIGLAFGATGIALALLRLHRVTGESRWLDAARRNLELDARRMPAEAPGIYSWAEGLGGLALVQLEQPDCHAAGCSNISDILDRLRTNIWSDGDSPCSGAMGRAELLAAAGFPDEARSVGLTVLDRARILGHYRLGWGKDCLHIGLFQGLTGVAYQMLRLAYPNEFPSILTWR